ncbi:hypothetical protein [Pseudoduganella chitinolytica]|uniref:PQQ-binding-like beta-propeller repeat protein n=1 Tax=Pseudoduganella chitinolytica TaxID=34070 RepID=A0ABY8B823_9BURK|nr:hypothetical protein [Pseudoduganella chitinolytica]WEF31153.1 hypothetical protein PX653_16970 [Pseudoduganella chitinolytica]
MLAALVVGCGGGGGDSPAAVTPPVTVPPVTVPPVPFVDTDKDGTADAYDVAPADPLCGAATDGAAGVCHVRAMAGTRLRIVGQADGKVFFSSEGDVPRVYGYDVKTGHFLGRVELAGFSATSYAYVAAHGRLYVGDTQGGVHGYSEALREESGAFATVAGRVGALAAAGNYLVVQDSSGAWGTHHVYDRRGARVDSKEWRDYSSQFAWSPAHSRLYYFRDGQSPNDLLFETIDQASGAITAQGETPYHGAYDIAGPIRANATGTRVLLGTGDVYEAPALTWRGNVGVEVTDAAWIGNDELLVLAQAAGRTRLVRYSAALAQLEELPLQGQVLGLVQAAGATYVVTQLADRVEFIAYTSSDDSDGDGYPNLSDKFPSDRTAAVDSDNDGHPDAFLAGFTAADSPTGLAKDFYPFDATCHAEADGNGFICIQAPPAFVPDRVIGDGIDVVYLLSNANGRIYRWSRLRRAYLAPLAVGRHGAAKVMAYSRDHQRLYLGYASGTITYIDVTGDSAETRLTALAQAVEGLAAAGKYLVAQDGSGAWATHYVLDRGGRVVASRDWNYFSRHYEWSASQSRLYYLRDDSSPNDIVYEQVDQATGALSASADSPYHGEFTMTGPLRLSGDGRLALGSGYVFGTGDLKLVKALGTPFIDAQWRSDGSLVTTGPDGGGGTTVTVYDTRLQTLRQQSYAGTPVALLKTGSSVVLVTQQGNTPRLTVLPR